MIRIHLGRKETDQILGAEVIKQPEDFVSARVAIRSAQQASQNLEVFVLTRICDGWFWDLEGDPEIELLQEDPVTLLCRKLDLRSLPPEVSDPDFIIGYKLLDLPLPSEPVIDVAGWIVGHTLDPVWAMTDPSYQHLTGLISWLSSNAVPESFKPLADRRIRSWIERANGQLRDAYDAIRSNPQKNSLFLACWSGLSAYDNDTRRRWLEEEGWYVQGLTWVAGNVGPMSLPALADKKLGPKAEAFWRRRLNELDKEARA